MKGIIILGGENYSGEINTDNAYVVACDRGYANAIKHGIVPDAVIGDFDSLGYVPENATLYKREKDFSDGEAAVDLMLKKSCDSVKIYCAGGGRDDHLLSNFLIAEKFLKSGINCEIITNFTKCFNIKEGYYTVPCKSGDTLSVISLSKCIIINAESGFKYKLDNLKIEFGSTLGLSNIATQDNPQFTIIEGYGLCFVAFKEIKFE